MILWFHCKNCDKTYSAIIYKDASENCPFCHSKKVERIYREKRGQDEI